MLSLRTHKPAPEGASNFARLAVSLKRYPDTKHADAKQADANPVWFTTQSTRSGASPLAVRPRLRWRLRDACACPCRARLPCESLRLRGPCLRVPQRERQLRLQPRLQQTRFQRPEL